MDDLKNAREALSAYDQLVDDLRAENERLRAALTDAIECTEHWAAYASDYFKEKHDYAGDVVRLRAALSPPPPAG